MPQKRYFLHYLITVCIPIFSCTIPDKKHFISFPEGGYVYQPIINDRDSEFYWYPVKDLITPNDSILMVYSGCDLYQSFDEPNLSLRPEKEIKFRLIGGGPPSVVIVVTESEIIIKEGKSGNVFPYTAENKLTTEEASELNLLRSNYPLRKKNTIGSARRNKWLDSLVAAKPRLLTAEYYLSLLEKSKTFGEESFTYDTRKMPISFSTFKKIADTLAASGYWSHSYQVACNSYPSDGSSYILEANTPDKYNIVIVDDCEVNSSPIANAYQYVANVAGMRKKVHIMGLSK